MWFTANFASATEKPLPADESSCWIRPSLEKPSPMLRYCSAAVMADCWDTVYCGAAGPGERGVPGAELVAAAAAAGAFVDDDAAGGLFLPPLVAAAITMIRTITPRMPRSTFRTVWRGFLWGCWSCQRVGYCWYGSPGGWLPGGNC